MNKKYITIFGVRIDNYSKEDALKKLKGFLSTDAFYQVATVNPEFLLEARRNEKFHNILNRCELTVPDGAGLNIAFWKAGRKMQERYPGVNLMLDLLKIANERKLKVFLVARKDSLSAWKETAVAIKKNYPRLEIGGVDIDLCKSNDVIGDVKSVMRSDADNKVCVTQCDLIFCNFGAPEQEYFLDRLRSDKMGVRGVAIGVGGSFDFITGKARRAPLWMQKGGIEWFYRLITQPRRLLRILNAVIIFPVLILFSQDHDK